MAWRLAGVSLVSGALLAAPADAAPGRRPDGRHLALADLDLDELVKVRISPFEVSSHLDSGYRAANSVSASRFDAPILELPFAVQAFTEAFIKDQKPVDLFDVARYSPGVTFRSNDFNEGNANLAIRGFAVGSLAGGNIQVLRDGLHGPSIFDFTNLSRVEVVKGPASFLYGQVAPGGIVNVITKTPQRRFRATGEARWGSYGEYRFEADVTGPASASLCYRVAASYGHDMAYWKPYDAHAWDVAPALLWQPSPDFKLTLKYEAFHKVETPQLMQKPGRNTQAGVVPTAADPNLSGVDVPGLPDTWNSMSALDHRYSDTANPSLWVDFEAGPHWDLRLGASHLTYSVDALATGNFGMADNATLLQGRRVRRQTYRNRDDSFQADGIGTYHPGPASLRILAGFQYVDRRFDASAGQAPNDPGLGNAPTGSPLPLWNLGDPSTWDRGATVPSALLTASPADQTATWVDQSIYGGATVGLLGDRLKLLAGWRLTRTTSHFTDRVAGVSYPGTADSEITPQYGALYRLRPGLSAYASYAESFVPGTFANYNPDGTHTIARPTVGRGIEAGLKADLFGGRLSGTFSLFDIRNRNIVNDLSSTDSAGTVHIYNVQSGEQRSTGAELDATATLGERWQAYLSCSWMDARITRFSADDGAILAQDWTALDAAGQANYKNVLRFHGAPLQMSAPWLANLWIRHDFHPAGRPGVYLAGGANWVRDQALLPDTPAWARQDYLLLNAMAGCAWAGRGRRMSLELMGRNLSDEHYRPSQSTRGRPREFLLSFRIGG